MKILFIVPPAALEERYGALTSAGAVYPSLGLAYLAAVAEVLGHQVRIIDAEAEGMSMSLLEEEIRLEQPQVIGLQTFCTTIKKCVAICDKAKEIVPGVATVLGGVHVTLYPEDGIRHPAVDYLVMGEGERTFAELLDLVREGGDPAAVDGLVWKPSPDGEPVHNMPRALIDDLDSLPFPARHLLPMTCYRSGAQLRGKRTVHLMTSRGCPFNCGFCSSHEVFGRTHRFQSTKRVLAEIRHVIEEQDADEIQFYDESFTANRKRILELCEGLRRSFPRLKWTCFTRTDLVKPDLLQEMKRAGCYQIFYGVESGVPRLLELVNKRIPLEKTEQAFRWTQQAGIQITASFILTLPTETVEETEQSIRFGIKLNPEFVYWLTFVPYPGTRLSEYALEVGTLTHDDPERYNVFEDVCYLPEGREPAEIERAVRRAYRRFYLRPTYLLRHGWKYLRLPPSKIFGLAKGGMKTLAAGIGLSGQQ
jgi:anaerobic magnesium-protoporphyrin IX monomethyl ester cyclase